MRIGTELSSFTPAFLKSSAVYVISTLVSVVVSEVSAVVSEVSVTTGSVDSSEVSAPFLHPARSDAITAVVSINAVNFLMFILSLSVFEKNPPATYSRTDSLYHLMPAT